MWDSETNFDYLNIISGKKKSLLDKTCSNFKIPTKGVVLLFDKCNYKDYPPRSIWLNLGNHLNIERGDGSKHRLPKTIKTIIESKNYSNLIWLSQRAWNGLEIDFVWNLSHELRHLERDIENQNFSLVHFWLSCNLTKMDIEPKIPNTVPTELDAELKAWQVTRKIIGKPETDDYVHKNAESGIKKADFRALLNYKPDEPYDLRIAIKSFLCDHQNQLDERINLAHWRYLDAFHSFKKLDS